MHERALVGKSWITSSGGRYILPPSCLVDKRIPSVASLLEDDVVGRQLVMRWSLTNSTSETVNLSWLEGVVVAVSPPNPPERPGVQFKVFWYLDRTRHPFDIQLSNYAWGAQSPQDSWFFLTRRADALGSVLRVLGHF